MLSLSKASSLHSRKELTSSTCTRNGTNDVILNHGAELSKNTSTYLTRDRALSLQPFTKSILPLLRPFRLFRFPLCSSIIYSDSLHRIYQTPPIPFFHTQNSYLTLNLCAPVSRGLVLLSLKMAEVPCATYVLHYNDSR